MTHAGRHEIPFGNLVLDREAKVRICGSHSENMLAAPFDASNPACGILHLPEIRCNEFAGPADVASNANNRTPCTTDTLLHWFLEFLR
jgi:hypothetical protein